MRITAVTVHDFKKIQSIKIEPPADCHLILLGGKNAQGKSSTLDAVAAAFGGAKLIPAEPVRRGAASAEIEIETDTGLQIVRTIAPDGTSKISIASRDGEMAKPQTVLNGLINTKFIDPTSFIRLPDKEKRDLLLGVCGIDRQVLALDLERESVFKLRTDENRDEKKARAALDQLPSLPHVEAVPTDAILAEAKQAQAVIDSFTAAEQEAARLRDRIEAGAKAIAAVNVEINELISKLDEAKRKRETYDATLAELTKKSADYAERFAAQRDNLELAQRVVAEMQTRVAAANETNRAAIEYSARERRRAELRADADARHSESETLTKRLADIEVQKRELLRTAKLQIEGFDIDTLRIDGTLFDDASEAQRYVVAIRVAMAAAPALKDIMIRNGAVLDGETLELINNVARAAGACVWVERGAMPEAGAIMIHDGRIVGAP